MACLVGSIAMKIEMENAAAPVFVPDQSVPAARIATQRNRDGRRQDAHNK
jgi:hypothetical protein